MKELKDILNDLIQFRYQKPAMDHYAITDLARIMCAKTKRKYFILRPTQRNIEFVDNLKEEYDNKIEIYDKYRDGREKLSRTVDSLIDFYYDILKKNISLKEALNKLTDKSIIIKKNDILMEHIEAVNIGHKLLNGSAFTLKQIEFYNGRKVELFSPNKKGLSERIGEFYHLLDKNMTVLNIGFNSNHTFEVSLKMSKELLIPFDKSCIRNVKEAKKYKEVLVREFKDYISKNVNINSKEEDLTIKDICVYTNIKEYEEIRANVSRSVLSMINVKNIYYKNIKKEFACTIVIKNIDFDYMMDIIDATIFKKKQIKDLLIS